MLYDFRKGRVFCNGWIVYGSGVSIANGGFSFLSALVFSLFVASCDNASYARGLILFWCTTSNRNLKLTKAPSCQLAGGVQMVYDSLQCVLVYAYCKSVSFHVWQWEEHGLYDCKPFAFGVSILVLVSIRSMTIIRLIWLSHLVVSKARHNWVEHSPHPLKAACVSRSIVAPWNCGISNAFLSICMYWFCQFHAEKSLQARLSSSADWAKISTHAKLLKYHG